MKVRLELLTDDELIDSLKALVGDERRIVASVLRHLSEFDRRRLATGRGYPSLFDYCVRELKYAQGEAARRIQSARAAAKYPVLYKAVERGFISLTVVSILAPHLKWNNYRKLIRASKGLSTREVEALVSSLNPVVAAPVERIRILTVAPPAAPMTTIAELFPPPGEVGPEKVTPIAPAAEVPLKAADAPLATETGAPTATAEPESAMAVEASTERTTPAAPASAGPFVPAGATPPSPPIPPSPPVRRAYFSFTADEAFLRDFERAKELSRHKWPAGRQEDVFAGAIKVLLEKIDPDRRRRRRERARRLTAGARSRGISRAVKDEVWERDGGRCVYPGPGGGVCGARAGLEFDHVRPWARGGSNDAANVRLLCRAHNDLEARRAFGGALVDAAVARRRSALRREVKI